LVVHVLYRLQVGGLENGVVNLVNQLPAGDYRHAIVCLSEATSFRERITRPDVEVHEMHKRPGQDFASWGRLYRLFRRLKPSVVHTRNIGCLEAQIPAWLAGVPCRVHGEHGWDVSDPDGSNRKYRLLRRAHAPLVHRFIALSRELESYLLQRVGISPAKVARIYNGVDRTRFHPADSNVLPEGFRDQQCIVFGTVGRMHGVKDQATLCAAFVELCKQRPDLRPGLRLVMIGDGPLRATCAAMLEQAGLSAQAWLPGQRDDVPAIMQALDVFVLPSLAEGISNTILEAMACGLPVIATAVGGNAELVIDRETGALVPPAEPDGMARAMAQYADDGELRRSHGNAAEQRITEHFSMQRMLSAYDKVYQQLMERRGLVPG
jgi:sugar transferase (PEP-CTERM/EpsH1 system associated)